ncbi:hypothetical protein [Bacteroidetes bacterium endosymbiont of Geopemphigus sp.]|uniref:hypothetical protein n=1 Tax=Bacteroidetes bacterium endosymbiont of Geopemphigus sp. TaxID=2047937 RepID=UPI000CD2F78C|nr:hypothetical protein [Bacteroidetes bacterium endosymbiont of Geopemphigus sp.]
MNLSIDKDQMAYSEEYTIKEYLIKKKKISKKTLLPIITEEIISNKNLTISDIYVFSYLDLNDSANIKDPDRLKILKKKTVYDPQATKSLLSIKL